MLFLALDLQRELVALRIGCFAVGRIEMWLNGPAYFSSAGAALS